MPLATRGAPALLSLTHRAIRGALGATVLAHLGFAAHLARIAHNPTTPPPFNRTPSNHSSNPSEVINTTLSNLEKQSVNAVHWYMINRCFG